MNPRIKSAEPLDNYKILINFKNKEIKIFDLASYLEIGVFQELKSYNKFKDFKVEHGTIVWATGQDLCPDTLYLESELIQ